MSLPGTSVTLVDSAPPRSAQTDTSVWFVVGFTEKGPVTAQLVRSMSEYASKFGVRVTYGLVYDALDVFFREGGGRAYVSRATGPTPVLATLNLLDGSSAIALVAKAKSYGDWGNSLKVEVTHPNTGTFKVIVYTGTTVLEDTGEVATTADAVAASASMTYIDLIQGASTNDPAVLASTSLASGTDDHANATDTEWLAALAKFGSDLGPGQVSMPGRTTDTAHTNLLAHASTHNRFALLDLPDTATAATLIAAAVAARTNGRWGAAYAPWAVAPGVAGGTTRTVPFSAIAAGLIARLDSQGNPNQSAAGRNGEAEYVIDLSQAGWNDADREDLNDAGVTVAIRKNGGIRIYGERTLANPVTEQNYLLAPNMRLVMAIVARSDVIAENFLFQEIDGAGHLIADFQGDLTGMLKPYYDLGALYGTTPGDAFYVDVGPQVNTPDTLAALELHAVLHVRMSPNAERVEIQILKTPITQSLA